MFKSELPALISSLGHRPECHHLSHDVLTGFPSFGLSIMKSISLLAAAVAVGSVSANPTAPGIGQLSRLQKRQGGLGGLVGGIFNREFSSSCSECAIKLNSTTAGYGKVAPPAGATAARVVLPPKTKVPGAKTVKLRYGPYKVRSHTGI